jgi:hypothetical protein
MILGRNHKQGHAKLLRKPQWVISVPNLEVDIICATSDLCRRQSRNVEIDMSDNGASLIVNGSKAEAVMPAQDLAQEKLLDQMEQARRFKLARSSARSSALMLGGVLAVGGVWVLFPQYTQFLWFGLVLLLRAVVGLLMPWFEKRGALAT